MYAGIYYCMCVWKCMLAYAYEYKGLGANEYIYLKRRTSWAVAFAAFDFVVCTIRVHNSPMWRPICMHISELKTTQM